jgi:hypothetical protein
MIECYDDKQRFDLQIKYNCLGQSSVDDITHELWKTSEFYIMNQDIMSNLDFVKEFKMYIDWGILLYTVNFSQDDIEYMLDNLFVGKVETALIPIIIAQESVDLEFIDKHFDKLGLTAIYYHVNLTNEFLEKHYMEIEDKQLLLDLIKLNKFPKKFKEKHEEEIRKMVESN